MLPRFVMIPFQAFVIASVLGFILFMPLFFMGIPAWQMAIGQIIFSGLFLAPAFEGNNTFAHILKWSLLAMTAGFVMQLLVALGWLPYGT